MQLTPPIPDPPPPVDSPAPTSLQTLPNPPLPVYSYPHAVTRPPNHLPSVTEVYAYVSVDPGTGNEGIVSAKLGDSWRPFVFADIHVARKFSETAKRLARDTGTHIRLIRLSSRAVITNNILEAT